jgi:hypothetical protein
MDLIEGDSSTGTVYTGTMAGGAAGGAAVEEGTEERESEVLAGWGGDIGNRVGGEGVVSSNVMYGS